MQQKSAAAADPARGRRSRAGWTLRSCCQRGLPDFAANLDNNGMVRSLPNSTSRWRCLPAREV